MSDASPLPLTPEERALLDDPATAPRFAALTLAGRSFDDLVVRGLTFDGASFEGSRFQRVHFSDCRFDGAEFHKAQLEEVRFERCVFNACRFERAELRQVSMLECQLAELFWQETNVTGALEHSELRNITFQGGQLQLTLVGGSVDTWLLSGCRITRLQFSEVRAEGLRVSFCQSDQLMLQLCSLERVQLIGGTCSTLMLYAGQLRDLKGAEFRCGRATFDSLESIETLHLHTCPVDQFVLEDCKRVEDLYVFQSKIGQLIWRGGTVAGWLAESTIGAGSRMEQLVLEDFFLDGSECTGLTLEAVALSRGLCARETRFVELRLQQVTYEPGVELVLDGASFERSDRFARPA